jgi:hypothetical protein
MDVKEQYEKVRKLVFSTNEHFAKDAISSIMLFNRHDPPYIEIGVVPDKIALLREHLPRMLATDSYSDVTVEVRLVEQNRAVMHEAISPIEKVVD